MIEFSSPPHYRRRPTRVVGIGDVKVGGGHPIRVQSMTTPATHDVAATVAQIRRLVEAGCEIVRLTVPSTRDAEALPAIRRELSGAGIRVPLVADIHFSPAAAMMAVEQVEKVRINPGNYADTKRFKIWEYSDAEYQAELERIEERFQPLVRRAKERGVSLRIGTNHGSLSDRILNRYGDTPLGMVESALEFVRICERRDFREIILSMKSSNPRVMIEAYRLLAQAMAAEGMDYPFHLGVTEAGDGEDGRIKSAVGIGTLLEEGIGDTVRVSLTEDPVAEVPVAFALVEKYNAWIGRPADPAPAATVRPAGATVDGTRRPATRVRLGVRGLGGTEPVRVEHLLREFASGGAGLERELESLRPEPSAPDARVEVLEARLDGPARLPALIELSRRLRRDADPPAISVAAEAATLAGLSGPDWDALTAGVDRVVLALAGPSSGWGGAAERFAARLAGDGPLPGLEGRLSGSWESDLIALIDAGRRIRAGRGRDPVLSLRCGPALSPIEPYRRLAAGLDEAGLAFPILLVADMADRREDALLFASVYLGALLCGGIGDAVRVERAGAPGDDRRIAYNILQGTRVRLFKTEFISCPSCGRTQFDLEETTRRIKARTGHLKGVKIAIMGCIVNGPGEMADADFGYVGWGPGKVSLFVGKDLVEKDIPFAEADDRLVRLIQDHGKWNEPPAEGGATIPAASGRVPD